MMEAPCPGMCWLYIAGGMIANRALIDYEKLEHVGDGILGSIVTTLLHDMYPLLKVGPSTVRHLGS
jgi:dsRNA-specific ribonuclease